MILASFNLQENASKGKDKYPERYNIRHYTAVNVETHLEVLSYSSAKNQLQITMCHGLVSH